MKDYTDYIFGVIIVILFALIGIIAICGSSPVVFNELGCESTIMCPAQVTKHNE